jgi:hypothetical protein
MWLASKTIIKAMSQKLQMKPFRFARKRLCVQELQATSLAAFHHGTKMPPQTSTRGEEPVHPDKTRHNYEVW